MTSRVLAAAIVSLAAGALACAPSEGARADTPPVRFNETMIEQFGAGRNLDVEDPLAVFRMVFSSLDDVVDVYPTENYYYFSFSAGGLPFAGNMRLDVADRDDGVLHFAYFAANAPWHGEILTRYRKLTGAEGVSVEREAPLRYAVTFEGRTVRFRLNDLSDVRPPAGAVRDGERYLGPVFDESGVQFYLLFDEVRSDFLFVLDERQPVPDRLLRVRDEHPALTVGARTGFSFFQDRFAGRKILVGVYQGNVEANNYYDGPFDQLPDNFMEEGALREAILEKYPDLAGQIDRFGGFVAQDGRFLVNPYLNYRSAGELEGFLRCTDPALDEGDFYRCILPEGPE